jgi:hypothetical protein
MAPWAEGGGTMPRLSFPAVVGLALGLASACSSTTGSGDGGTGGIGGTGGSAGGHGGTAGAGSGGAAGAPACLPLGSPCTSSGECCSFVCAGGCTMGVTSGTGGQGVDSGIDGSRLQDCTGLVCGSNQQVVNVRSPALGTTQCACLPVPSAGECMDCTCGDPLCVQYGGHCTGFSADKGLLCSQNG